MTAVRMQRMTAAFGIAAAESKQTENKENLKTFPMLVLAVTKFWKAISEGISLLVD